MNGYSTREAAKKLGLSKSALSRYIAAKKIPTPKAQVIGGVEIRSWTDNDIEKVRKILPELKNGRKTRYKKKSLKKTSKKK
jgi:predicted transcriptional regulator